MSDVGGWVDEGVGGQSDGAGCRGSRDGVVRRGLLRGENGRKKLSARAECPHGGGCQGKDADVLPRGDKLGQELLLEVHEPNIGD